MRQIDHPIIRTVTLILLVAQSAVAPRANTIPVGSSEELRVAVGGSIDVALDCGEPRRVVLELQGGMCTTLVVRPRNVDVEISVIGPDRTVLATSDLVYGWPRAEQRIRFVPSSGGDHVVELSPSPPRFSGHCEIVIEPQRPLDEHFRAMVAAEKSISEPIDLLNKGDLGRAVELGERSIGAAEAAFGPDSRELAGALGNLTFYYVATSKYELAESTGERALACANRAFDGPDPDRAQALINYAQSFYYRGRIAETVPSYETAVGMLRDSLGPQHPRTAAASLDLAAIALQSRDVARAEELTKRAVETYRNAYPPGDEHLRAALQSLARVDTVSGKYTEAAASAGEALELARASGDEREYAVAFERYGRVYLESGEFAKAEPLLEEALVRVGRAFRREDGQIVDVYEDLARVYLAFANYNAAQRLLVEALARVRENPERLLELIRVLSNLAVAYEGSGRYEEAERAIAEAVEVAGRVTDPNYVRLPGILLVYADIEDALGKSVDAERLYQRSLDAGARLGRSDPGETARALAGLSRVRAAAGDFSEADEFLAKAQGALTKGGGDTDRVRVLSARSWLCERQGDAVGAAAAEREIFALRDRFLARLRGSGYDRRLLALDRLSASDASRCVTMHLGRAPKSRVSAAVAVESILRAKGRSLQIGVGLNDELRRSRAADDRDAVAELSAARSLLALTAFRWLADPTPALRAEMDREQARVDALDKRLSTRMDLTRDAGAPPTLDGVCARIPERTAFVEYVFYEPHDLRSGARRPRRLAAYVLERRGEVSAVDLGTEDEIDRAIASFRDALEDPDRSDVAALGAALRRRIFDPIRLRIGDARRLLVAPDGQLNLVPFEALAENDGRYLIRDYEFDYLASGRDLTATVRTPEEASRPVVVGAPDFGAAPARDDGARRRFAPLPGSAIEAEDVAHVLGDASVLTGAAATETAVKELVSPEILHVASHGYFASDRAAIHSGGRDVVLAASGAQSAVEDIDPMLRSGLALANANEPPHGSSDGILTALEVASLDLSGTRLVVLSACDSGLGDVETVEGVVGLRRAVFLAGAETLVASLWGVHDGEAASLMKVYYEALARGEARGEALRTARLRLAGNQTTRHPFYWASFISAGEWGPIGLGAAHRGTNAVTPTDSP